MSCLGHHGRQQVEISASDEHGPTTLANFPVWCGESPPASMNIEYDPRDAEALTAEQAEARLLALINADRARYGLRALRSDPAVAAVARAHSEEMRKTGVIAHITPRDGSAVDRLEAARIFTPVVQENLARAYGVVEAEQALMNSPGHRANILSRVADRVGIGIVVGQRIADRNELFITQLFTFSGHVIDLSAATGVVRGSIQRQFTVQEDPQLSKLAALQARELARGVSAKDSIRYASEHAFDLTGRYSRVTSFVLPVLRLSSFDPRQVFDPSITSFGVGVAQGPAPKLGDHAIYIVILAAQGTAFGGHGAPKGI